MDRNDIDELARFNAERARGIMHTPELVARMRVLQGQFDAWQDARMRAAGWELTDVPGVTPVVCVWLRS